MHTVPAAARGRRRADVRAQPVRAVREHDALGPPGAAAREEDDVRVALVELGRGSGRVASPIGTSGANGTSTRAGELARRPRRATRRTGAAAGRAYSATGATSSSDARALSGANTAPILASAANTGTASSDVSPHQSTRSPRPTPARAARSRSGSPAGRSRRTSARRRRASPRPRRARRGPRSRASPRCGARRNLATAPAPRACLSTIIVVSVSLVMKDSDTLTTIFREQGLRVTPQRQAIFRLLHGDDSHPTVESLFERARAEMPTISLKTVYQTVHDLEALGEVRRARSRYRQRARRPERRGRPPPSRVHRVRPRARPPRRVRRPAGSRSATAATSPSTTCR